MKNSPRQPSGEEPKTRTAFRITSLIVTGLGRHLSTAGGAIAQMLAVSHEFVRSLQHQFVFGKYSLTLSNVECDPARLRYSQTATFECKGKRPMLSQGKELAAIDFAQVIGAPLQAVITAQASAAQLTTDFIQRTAFVQTQGSTAGSNNGAQQLKVVEFDYTQLIGAGGLPGCDGLSLKVPLLTMVPIPFIRIDSMTIDLNVNLHATNTMKESNEASVSVDADGSENLEFERSEWKTSISDKNTFQNDQLIDDTYSLHVTVNAVQDQMPAGMASVLGIFTNVIQQQSALIQQVMSATIAAQTAKFTAAQKVPQVPTH